MSETKQPKIIFLDKKYPNEGVLGQFVDESNFDILLTEDADVYKASTDGELSEQNCLVKFRKNVFPSDVQAAGVAGLAAAATVSDNRGLAAGRQISAYDYGQRLRVSKLQIELLQYFMSNSYGAELPGVDPIADILSKHKEETLTELVWIVSRTIGFDWNTWFESTKDRDPAVVKQEAFDLWNHKISDTHYFNQVHSGLAGFFDRYVRIPYCRTTSYTASNMAMFQKAYPYIQAVSEQFKKLMPERFSAQNQAMQKVDPAFRVSDTAFTTITCNKTFRTACHRDAGDFAAGFGCITALDNGKKYSGAYLVFPEHRVAVDLRPGDMLCFDPHEIHGNCQIKIDEEGAERYSFVFYLREGILECESAVIEKLRYDFVQSNAVTKPAKGEKKFNGVSVGMWSSKQWMEYLINHGQHEYVENNKHLFVSVMEVKNDNLDSLFGE